jgi:hypothetical protein
MMIAHVVIEHVRGRVDAAQRAVQREGRCGEGLRHALRQHDLHDVAVENVLLGFFYRRLECGFTEFGFRIIAQRGRLKGNVHRPPEHADEFAQALAR